MRPIYTLSILLTTLAGIAVYGQHASNVRRTSSELLRHAPPRSQPSVAANEPTARSVPDEEVHASLVAGKKRSMIAYAGKDHSFTMDVNAKTTKVSDLPGFITVDGQIVQATLVPSQPAIDARRLTTAQEKDALTKYMNYELSYYKKKLKQNYTQLQTEWITVKDRLFLVWYFDMPKDYKLVSRQLYFSTLFTDQVLDLNAPVFKTEQFSRARGILNRLVNSLKTYDKYLDIEGLKKELGR